MDKYVKITKGSAVVTYDFDSEKFVGDPQLSNKCNDAVKKYNDHGFKMYKNFERCDQTKFEYVALQVDGVCDCGGEGLRIPLFNDDGSMTLI